MSTPIPALEYCGEMQNKRISWTESLKFEIYLKLELGRFTIQIRDYDSKSQFMMNHESLIQNNFESIQ